MSKKIKYSFVAIICLLFTFVLSGCNAGAATTYSTVEEELKTTQLEVLKNEVREYVKTEGMADEDKNLVNTALIGANSDLKTNINYNNIQESLTKAFTTMYNATPEAYKSELKSVDLAVEDAMEKQLMAVVEKALEQVESFTTKASKDKRESHQVYLCDQLLEEYRPLVLAAKSANLAGKVVEEVTESEDVYQIVKNYTIKITEYELQPAPLMFYTGKEFWAHLFNNFLIFPIGWVMKTISQLFGGLYIIGLLVATILVRTIGWPIYAKTNDMSMKMQLMQPEINKLEAKYATRTDPESQRMKQMEQMQLYKKYKVGLGGCLMPILQFPIFMGIYRAVSRMPYTNGTIPGSNDWVTSLNTKVFGVDLFLPKGALWTTQFWGIIVILIIVVATQIVSQVMMDRRQKKQQEEKQKDIPEYRRQAAAQTSQANTMKYMMYFMIFMMAVFVWQSPAGLGVYWCIGNVYSIVQTIINSKLSAKKMQQMRIKNGY